MTGPFFRSPVPRPLILSALYFCGLFVKLIHPCEFSGIQTFNLLHFSANQSFVMTLLSLILYTTVTTISKYTFSSGSTIIIFWLINTGLPGIHLVQMKTHLWFRNNYRYNLLITLYMLAQLTNIKDRYYYICVLQNRKN